MPRYYGVARFDEAACRWRPLRITTDRRAAGPEAIDLGEHATPEAALSALNAECGDLNAEAEGDLAQRHEREQQRLLNESKLND